MLPDYAQFPGLSITGADFVLTHGVTPSSCVVSCVPMFTQVAPGTLTFYSQGSPAFSFYDCALDESSTALISAKRGQRITARILDRRWRWKGKKISGTWNRRADDGSVIDDTEKTYKELITLILDELGEVGFEVNILYPNMVAPTVQWLNASADLELAWLVSRIGCSVTLGLDNKIRVVQGGAGTIPNAIGLEQTEFVGVQASTAPEKIRVAFAPTRYQSLLRLRAVGMDADGVVRPIDQLTYKPTTGWSSETPGLWAGLNPQDITKVSWNTQMRLAVDTVYKWYWISTQDDGSLNLPGGGSVGEIEDVLPLFPVLAMPESATWFTGNAAATDPPHRPRIGGSFHTGQIGSWNNLFYTAYTHDDYGDLYFGWLDEPFELDCINGIVKFQRPVYLHAGVDVDGTIDEHVPAELWLLCSYNARDKDGLLNSHTVEYVTGAPGGSGIETIIERDQFLWQINQYIPDTQFVKSVKDNAIDIESHGNALAAARASQYVSSSRYDTQLVGVVPIGLDGVVQQVRWIVRAGVKSETIYSLAGEPQTAAPGIKERRASEILENLSGGGYV